MEQNPVTESSSQPRCAADDAENGSDRVVEVDLVTVMAEEAKVEAVQLPEMAEESPPVKVSMGPPPLRALNSTPKSISGGNPSLSSSFIEVKLESEGSDLKEALEKPSSRDSSSGRQFSPPYAIPPWSGPPGKPFYFEVLKDGSIVGKLDVLEKGAYMFGRVDLCDFVLEHPTISRFHAVLQYRKESEAFIYDLGSTHGTFLNKRQIMKKSYTEVHVGDIIRFGQSSRLYIFQGPSDLMPPEGDLKNLRNARVREELQDREASLLRARAQASMEDGISWGMGEDAIEDTSENDAEEVTWQNYKGQLTERQEKTRSKIIKRMEKVSNMRKEIDSIRAKDIAQGGLTQGQQTQIARNEQRMGQILEELESLEETLNDSIQESMGARAKTSHGKKKGASKDDDEDEILSDEDEFYDRTKPKPKKHPEQKVVETAETLLDKKDALVKEIEEKIALFEEEKCRMNSDANGTPEDGDELDAYMTGLSSQLVLDKTTRIQGEISTLQSELDRILYLLKIADPSGESAKKRESKKIKSASTHVKEVSSQPEKILAPKKPDSKTTTSPPIDDIKPKSKTQEESKPAVFSVPKPQWLGAVKEGTAKSEEEQQGTGLGPEEKQDEFIDYKDRKVLIDEDGLEQAEAGLILRKRKQERREEAPAASALDAESAVADAVALLLKHKKGYVPPEDEVEGGDESGKKKAKRVLGPERPPFLERSSEYEAWMPPEGQSGDGRTSLNERLGY